MTNLRARCEQLLIDIRILDNNNEQEGFYSVLEYVELVEAFAREMYVAGLREAGAIALRETELPGIPPAKVVRALLKLSLPEQQRAAVRATKQSIARAIEQRAQAVEKGKK